MLLKDYLKALKKIEKQHGGNLELIYGIDEEGNGFEFVCFSPSVKYINKKKVEQNGYMDCMDLEETKTTDKNTAVVCIN